MLYSAKGLMDMTIMDLDITDKKKVRDEQQVTIQTLGKFITTLTSLINLCLCYTC